MKFIVWLAFFTLVAWALYAKRTSLGKPKPVASQRRREFDSTGAELTVRCHHCGVYLPISEAINYRDTEYCCDEHRGKPPIF